MMSVSNGTSAVESNTVSLTQTACLIALHSIMMTSLSFPAAVNLFSVCLLRANAFGASQDFALLYTRV